MWSIAFPKLVRYTYFSLPFAFCLKPITFVPQQTEKRYIFNGFSMTTDAAIMADLNFAGIDKANPRVTTKTMLPVNAQRDESRGHPLDKTLIARQLGELLSPVETNRIEVEMLKITVVVLMEYVYELYYRAKALSVLI